VKFQVTGAKLLAVADVVLESAEKVADELEVPICEKDYHRLLENDDLHAVIICSSTDTHAQIIAEAAEARKHIFCEKPIALEMDKIDRALAAVRKAGVKLQVDSIAVSIPVSEGRERWWRWAKWVSLNSCGSPAGILNLLPRLYSLSGGLFLDMMIHDFDMARFLMKEEVDEVLATGTCLIDPSIGKCGDVDTAVVLLKFRSGALGTLTTAVRPSMGTTRGSRSSARKGRWSWRTKRPQK